MFQRMKLWRTCNLTRSFKKNNKLKKVLKSIFSTLEFRKLEIALFKS